MSRHNPGFEDRVRAFTSHLTEYRESQHMTQEEMADHFDLSRKTYILYEQGRWLPGPRQGHHMVHLLHRLDPALAEEYARLYDTNAQWWGVAPPAPPPLPPQPAPRIGAQHAKSAYDAAVYAAAEEAEIPAKLLRPVIAAVLASLQDAGMPLEQAAEVAKAATQAKTSRGGTGAGASSPRYRVDEAGEGDEGTGREGAGRRKR